MLRVRAAAVGELWQRPPRWGRTAMLLLAVGAITGIRAGQHANGLELAGRDWPELLPHLRAADGREALSWWTGDWVQHNGYYRPLTSCSLYFDYRLTGEGWPRWWRMHNVVLIALTAMLLALLTRALAGSDLAALVAGTTSTGWLVEWTIVQHITPRTDVLCALFMLAALLLALQWAKGGRAHLLAGALACVALSALSKEMALLLAALVPLTLWAAGAPRRRSVIATAACIVLLVAYWLLRSRALDQPLWQPTAHIREHALPSRAMVLAMVMVPLVPSLSFYRSLDLPMLTLCNTWLHFAEDLASVVQYPLAGLHRARLLLLGLLWKASIWPLTGFALVTPHYLYIPRLGDCLLYGCAAAQLVSMLSRRRRPTEHEAPESDGA